MLLPSVVLGASTHVSFALSYTSTLTVTFGFSVSLVISLVVVPDSSVSGCLVVGFVTTLLCLTVTVPVGSKPLLSANSSAPNVTLVAPAGTSFVIVLLPSVRVTVAPGVTSVTVIPFGRPPVFVT